MKMRIILVLLLLILNVADFSITRIAIQAGQPVEEANPIINAIVSNGGWDAVLLYKTAAILVLAVGLSLIFNRAAWLRIMFGVCVGFSIILLYTFGLLLYNHIFL